MLYGEDELMHFLRMHRGEIVCFWAPCVKVANVLTNHEVVHVPVRVRASVRSRLGKTLSQLIWQGKVVRYPHPKNNQKSGVRINEAYAEFRSLHHDRKSAA